MAHKIKTDWADIAETAREIRYDLRRRNRVPRPLSLPRRTHWLRVVVYASLAVILYLTPGPRPITAPGRAHAEQSSPRPTPVVTPMVARSDPPLETQPTTRPVLPAPPAPAPPAAPATARSAAPRPTPTNPPPVESAASDDASSRTKSKVPPPAVPAATLPATPVVPAPPVPAATALPAP